MLLRNSACIMKMERPITKRRDDFFRIIFLHILSNFQLNSIKTQGGDTKNLFLEKQVFVKIGHFSRKTVKISPVSQIFYFSSYLHKHVYNHLGDFQHNLAYISGIMALKVPKISQFWTPNFLIN